MRKTIAAVAVALALVGLAACSGQPPSTTGAGSSAATFAYKNVTPVQLKQMLTTKDFVMINVHVPYEGELAQTDAFIPYTDIEQGIGTLPVNKDSKIMLYCRSGNMSSIAANALAKVGYTNVWNLDGGFVAWEKAGLPVLQKKP